MDDPWAAPSWSTPAQPSGSKPISFSPPRSPPKDLGSDDPWGAPVSAAQSPVDFTRASGEQQRDVDLSPGWGGAGGWGEGMDFSVPTARVDGVDYERPSSPEPPSWATTTLGPPSVDHEHVERAVESEEENDPEVDLASQSSQSTSAVPEEQPPRFPSPPPLDLPISRTDTPSAPAVVEDDDPEAAFAAALPRAAVDDMPKFDISGSENRFAGFSEPADVSWSGAAALDAEDGGWAPEPTAHASSPHFDTRDQVEDGWGSSKPTEETYTAQAPEMDWEATQRRLQLQDRMMPLEEINKLKKQWTDASTEVFGKALQAKSVIIRELDEPKGREALCSLSTIPSDINTYPPVLSSFQTYTTYQTTVGRANPTPSTSILLSTTSAARRARPTPVAEAPWLSRSRLGEPESIPAAQPEAESKSKWSFWGKKPEPKPLVTSGGGSLEIKSPVTAQQRPGMSSRQASISMSNTSNRPSRTGSPAPTSLFDEIDDMSAQTGSPGLVTSPVAAAQPSAVSRFFGRLGRRQSTQPSDEANDTKDLELGADDFSFLQEVPSLAPVDKSQGDLLGMETGRSETIASLESMIASKPVALPKPLAPPPIANVPRPATNMDLLSGVFGESPTNQATPTATQDRVIGWDDFMTPPTSSTHTPAPGAVASPPPAVPAKSPPRLGSSFGDFDDFATPQPATSAKFSSNDEFDDFGDFSDFAAAPTPDPAPAPARTISQERVPFAISTPAGHAPRSSLDHTPTLNLLDNVNAVKGKRWPAPPSPDVPVLSPPPGRSSTPTSFPFLSPPPPGRPSSGLGKSAQLDLFADESKSATAPAAVPKAPSPTPPPPSKPPSAPSKGLTAQDLSFFDTL